MFGVRYRCDNRQEKPDLARSGRETLGASLEVCHPERVFYLPTTSRVPPENARKARLDAKGWSQRGQPTDLIRVRLPITGYQSGNEISQA